MISDEERILEEEEYVPLHVPCEFRELRASDGKLTVRDLWGR